VTTTPTAVPGPLTGRYLTPPAPSPMPGGRVPMTPSGGPAGTCRPAGAVTAGAGAGPAPPACPGCGASLRWLTGSTLACQRCAYSLEQQQ